MAGLGSDRLNSAIDEASLEVGLACRADRLRTFLAAKLSPHLKRHVSEDDLLQEVWISAFQSLPGRTLAGKDALDRWLYRVASQKLAFRIREARRLKRGGGLVPAEPPGHWSSYEALQQRLAADTKTPSSHAAGKETKLRVRLAIASLSQRRRRAIELFHMDGLSIAEVDQKMDSTVPAVKNLLSRARAELRRHMGRASRYFSGPGAA